MEELSILEAGIRVLAAAVAGLLIGLERERLDKTAGLRTLALVSSGCAIFVVTAAIAAPTEIVRLAAGAVTGIGFLGAGVILQERGQVLGLTTAATVWTAAALGVSAGLGALPITAIGTVLALFLLSGLGSLDLSRIQRDSRVYEITYRSPEWEEAAAAQPLRDAGLDVSLIAFAWSGECATATWRAVGQAPAHERGMRALKGDPTVASFTTRD